MIEIEPASIGQVRSTDEGDLVWIDDDVNNVAASLRKIDPGLRLGYDKVQDYFVVRHVHTLPDGSVEESLVTTATECDQRLVQKVNRIGDDGYDFAGELEKAEASAAAAREHEQREQVGEAGESLAHALRKDLGLGGNRAFIPGV